MEISANRLLKELPPGNWYGNAPFGQQRQRAVTKL